MKFETLLPIIFSLFTLFEQSLKLREHMMASYVHMLCLLLFQGTGSMVMVWFWVVCFSSVLVLFSAGLVVVSLALMLLILVFDLIE